MNTQENENDISTFFQQNTGKRWSLVQIKPRNEKYVNSALATAGVVVYLPLITKVEIHNRSKRETFLPMFPGYLFACPNLEEETTIRRNKSVWNLKTLSECEEKSLIADLIMVRKCELLSKEHKLTINPNLKEGDTVFMKKGPFKNFEVIVLKRKDESKIVVNLNFLGRNIEILCNADELGY